MVSPSQAVRVPLLDLKVQYRWVKDQVDEAVARVHERGNYVMGEEVEAFEAEWAADCQANFCVGVSSGTDAIYLALRALHGDFPTRSLVWAPSATFIGTVEPVIRAGHRLRLTDVDDQAIMAEPEPGSSDILLPVALYGRPVSWVEEQVRRGQAVIEDLAQAHGHPLRGTLACFSFYPTKNLGCAGQGGAVVTNDADLAEKIRQLRNHGEGDVRFRHEHLSGNYRLDELQAAILRAKLPHLGYWNYRRRGVARTYIEMLSGLPGITVPQWHEEHVWHIFALRSPRRNDLAAFLAERGIQTAVRYPLALHQQPALEKSVRDSQFPVASAWARENLSLPIFPELEDADVDYVGKAVREWAEMRA